MAEFKTAGDEYISEWNGDSGNPGTDVSPFSHPADGVAGTKTAIVGPGFYFGGGILNRRYTGDGHPTHIVFDLDGNPINFGSSLDRDIKNIHIKNASFISARAILENCIIDESNLVNTVSGGNYYWVYKSVIIHSDTVINLSNATKRFYDCLLLSNIDHTGQTANSVLIDGCYLPKGKKVIIGSAGSLSLTRSLINGIINLGGTDYELKKLFDGSARPDADPLVSDIIGIKPNVYTTDGCFAGDAKIIDPLNKIVEPDSDLLKKTGVYGFLGNVSAGRSISKGDSGPDLTITTSQIDTSDPSSWSIQSGYDEGYVFITAKLSDNIVQVPKIHFNGLLAFDSSQAGGSVGNNNVPDFFPNLYTPLTQGGLKPNRKTFGFRTSKNVSKPSTEIHWDNDNSALSTDVSRYYVQEWSDQPRIANVLGVTYGNGDPEFPDAATKNTINARWIQVQVRLTNRRTQ